MSLIRATSPMTPQAPVGRPDDGLLSADAVDEMGDTGGSAARRLLQHIIASPGNESANRLIGRTDQA